MKLSRRGFLTGLGITVATKGAAFAVVPETSAKEVMVEKPATWLLCDGAEISRTDYQDLFALIGDIYGSGDGETTFNLPDMRSQVDQTALKALVDHKVLTSTAAPTWTFDYMIRANKNLEDNYAPVGMITEFMRKVT